MKSLPTYSIPLTDGAWEVPDAPVINEIEKSVKSYYAVNIYLLKKFLILIFILHRNKQQKLQLKNRK
jgi:hypothetical protein